MMILFLECIDAYLILTFIEGMNGESLGEIPILLWLGLLMFQYYLQVKFLSKERGMNSRYLLNTLYFVCNTTVLSYFTRQDYVLIALASLFLAIRMSKLIYEEITDSVLLTHFELSVLALLFYFFLLESDYELPLSGTICAVTAPVLAMVSMQAVRSGSRGRGLWANNLRSPGVLAAGGIFAGLLAWAGAARISLEYASGKMEGLGARLGYFIYQLFYRFALALTRFAWTGSGEMSLENESESLGSLQGTADSSISVDGLKNTGLLIFSVILIFLVLRFLYKNRLNKSSPYAGLPGEGFAESGTFAGMGAIRFLLGRLRMELLYYRNRDNELGAYLWLLRYGRKRGLSPEKGVTIREYIGEMDRRFFDGKLEFPVDNLEVLFYDKRPWNPIHLGRDYCISKTHDL